MLSMILHLLKDSSTDETGVQWKWWDQHQRRALWYRALARQDVSIRKPVLKDHFFNRTMQGSSIDFESVFVLWVHCTDWEGYECMMSEMELRRLYGAWSEWANNDWPPFNVSEHVCLLN